MTRTIHRDRLTRAVVFVTIALITAGIAGLDDATAQGLDLGGWTIEQANSSSTYTIPSGTVIQPGGYLVLGRHADRAAFEAFHGVTLGANVIYLTNASEAPAVPMINGDEVYELYDGVAALLVDLA